MSTAPRTHNPAQHTRPRAVVASVLLLAAAFCCFPRRAQSAETAPDYAVEAAYLFNFTKFVQWPASAFAGEAAPFTICVVGEDRLARALDEIVKGELVDGHRIVVGRTETPASASCQVVYFDTGQHVVDASTVGTGTLTVGSGDAFLRRGGMIAFVMQDRRVRFDVNLRAALAGNLKLSSKLLSVARSIER